MIKTIGKIVQRVSPHLSVWVFPKVTIIYYHCIFVKTAKPTLVLYCNSRFYLKFTSFSMNILFCCFVIKSSTSHFILSLCLLSVLQFVTVSYSSLLFHDLTILRNTCKVFYRLSLSLSLPVSLWLWIFGKTPTRDTWYLHGIIDDVKLHHLINLHHLVRVVPTFSTIKLLFFPFYGRIFSCDLL